MINPLSEYVDGFYLGELKELFQRSQVNQATLDLANGAKIPPIARIVHVERHLALSVGFLRCRRYRPKRVLDQMFQQ